MTDTQQQAVFSLCLQAAVADGTTSPAERSALEGIAGKLRAAGIAVELPASTGVSRTFSLRELAQELKEPVVARSAFETAVAVCAADEPPNQAEKWFLEELRQELGLNPSQATEVQRQADLIVSAPVNVPTPPMAPVLSTAPASMPSTGPADAEMEKSILHHAMLAGALELLPSTLATMAILPVQMRLVYQIGKAHGYELDRGHIKDFLATAGVGLASQVVESYAERLVRSLAGRLAGGLVRGLVGQATSSGMSFATTWALGQLARQYYAGGRRFGAIEIRDLYDRLMGEGRALQSNYAPQIREQAGKLNLSSITSMLRT